MGKLSGVDVIPDFEGLGVVLPKEFNIYRNAKKDAWNVDDLPWEKVGEMPKQMAQEAQHFMATTYTGEYGAMLGCEAVASQIKETDAHFAFVSQIWDEARHTEVFSRFIVEAEVEPYECPEGQAKFISQLLKSQNALDVVAGLQCVAENGAITMFGALARKSKYEIIRIMCNQVVSDEKRHTGLGMIYLPYMISKMPRGEQSKVKEMMFDWGRLTQIDDRMWAGLKACGLDDLDLEDAVREGKHRVMRFIESAFSAA